MKVKDLWFTSACNAHDRCYSTCGKAQTVCDERFQIDMSAICDTLSLKDSITCHVVSGSYGTGITIVGKKHYEAAQDKHCEHECCK